MAVLDRFPEHADKPHYVYRFFDASDRLLYIGCTLDWKRRENEHRWYTPWSDDIAHCEVVRYPDQASALLAEEEAIKAESPVHNAMYNGAGLTGWNEERRQSETCLHGHPWEGNSRVTSQGIRVCRECERIANWRYDAKRGRPYAIRKLAEIGEQVAS